MPQGLCIAGNEEDIWEVKGTQEEIETSKEKVKSCSWNGFKKAFDRRDAEVEDRLLETEE